MSPMLFANKVRPRRYHPGSLRESAERMVLISGMPEPIAVGSISRVDPIESMEKKTPHRQRADKGTRNEMKLAPAAADDEDDDDGAKEESTGVIDSSRVSTWKCA